MSFYCGIDLHAKKSQMCIIDMDTKKVKEGNLNNDLSLILEFLEPSARMCILLKQKLAQPSFRRSHM